MRRPHALLIVGEEECRRVDGIRLGRIPADAMVAAIRPCALTPALEAAATRFAERAAGLPGRFASLLWRQRLDAREAGRSARTRAAGSRNRRRVYGGEDALPMNCSSQRRQRKSAVGPCPASWPTLRRRRDAAVVDLTQGRHAPGLRQLRQAIGGLARRGDWAGACDGALALAGPLLRRGRTRAALAAIDEGRDYAGVPAAAASLVDFAIAQRRGVDRSRAAGRSRERARQRARGCSFGGGRGALRIGVAGACPLPLLARPLRRCCGSAGRSGRSSPARAHDPAPPAGGASADWPRRSRRARCRWCSKRARSRRGPPTAVDALPSPRPARSSTSPSAIWTPSSATPSESLAAAQAERDPLRALRARLLQLGADRRARTPRGCSRRPAAAASGDGRDAAGAARALGAVHRRWRRETTIRRRSWRATCRRRAWARLRLYASASSRAVAIVTTAPIRSLTSSSRSCASARRRRTRRRC